MNSKFILSAFILTCIHLNAAQADMTGKLIARVQTAQSTIDGLAGVNAPRDSSVPRALLEQAVCLVSVPNYKKAGLVFGGSYGAGLATCRDSTGYYGAPFFVQLVGGSWGLQIGVQSADLLFVMTEQNAEAELIRNGGFKLGVEGTLTVGPLGRDAYAGTSTDFREKTFSYSTSRGIFGGLTLNGSKLSFDSNANLQIRQSPALFESVAYFQAYVNSLAF